MSTTTSVGIVVLTPSLGCSAISIAMSVGSIFFLSVDIFSGNAWDMPCLCVFASLRGDSVIYTHLKTQTELNVVRVLCTILKFKFNQMSSAMRAYLRLS